MNKKIKELWTESILKYCAKPSYFRLQYPMKLSSTKGDLYSIFGLLCEIHAAQNGNSWMIDEYHGSEEKSKKEKLPNIIGYRGEHLVPPQEVLVWAGLTESEVSRIANRANSDGFESVISFINSEF